MSEEREKFIEDTMNKDLPQLYAAAEKSGITINEDLVEHIVEDSLRAGWDAGWASGYTAWKDSFVTPGTTAKGDE